MPGLFAQARLADPRLAGEEDDAPAAEPTRRRGWPRALVGRVRARRTRSWTNRSPPAWTRRVYAALVETAAGATWRRSAGSTRRGSKPEGTARRGRSIVRGGRAARPSSRGRARAAASKFGLSPTCRLTPGVVPALRIAHSKMRGSGFSQPSSPEIATTSKRSATSKWIEHAAQPALEVRDDAELAAPGPGARRASGARRRRARSSPGSRTSRTARRRRSSSSIPRNSSMVEVERRPEASSTRRATSRTSGLSAALRKCSTAVTPRLAHLLDARRRARARGASSTVSSDHDGLRREQRLAGVEEDGLDGHVASASPVAAASPRASSTWRSRSSSAPSLSSTWSASFSRSSRVGLRRHAACGRRRAIAACARRRADLRLRRSTSTTITRCSPRSALRVLGHQRDVDHDDVVARRPPRAARGRPSRPPDARSSFSCLRFS